MLFALHGGSTGACKVGKMMGASSDSADNESTSSNSVGHECGCRLAEPVLRNSLTALLVDGVTACRLIANDMLESVGIETEMVGSGQEPLELIEAHYNLILVDRYVYDTSGPEVKERKGKVLRDLFLRQCDCPRNLLWPENIMYLPHVAKQEPKFLFILFFRGSDSSSSMMA